MFGKVAVKPRDAGLPLLFLSVSSLPHPNRPEQPHDLLPALAEVRLRPHAACLISRCGASEGFDKATTYLRDI